MVRRPQRQQLLGFGGAAFSLPHPGVHGVFQVRAGAVVHEVRLEKARHCQHNEKGLCAVNVTWRPRRGDWSAHA